MRPPTDPDLITLHAAAVALARSMRGEPDARRFVEGLSPHLREVIPHDRLLLVRDVPADLQPERRLEDYSFGARLAAKEIVLLGDARRELDQSFPGDRAALERGVRSVIVAPLVFGDTLGGVLAFAKHDPDWF